MKKRATPARKQASSKEPKPVRPEPQGTPPEEVGQRSLQAAFPIVGIGASAGGLEALELFLGNVPEGSGMAFVIVQHLDPTHKGIMAELLQRATAMKVVQVKDRTRVQPDCVYVIPPNKDMSILHGVLHLLDPVAPRGLRLPIDFFFRSLADDRQEQSIGVILSGMGSDGTLGLRAIKEKAGVVFVQDAGLGQVRRHAPQRHRRRVGRRRRPGGGAARQDHRLSPARAPHRRARTGRGRQSPERPRKGRDPAAGADGPRFFPVQEEHRLPPDRAAHGHPPD